MYTQKIVNKQTSEQANQQTNEENNTEKKTNYTLASYIQQQWIYK